MNFVDELLVHFLKRVETAAIAAAKTTGQCDREFSEDIVIDSPGVIPVTIN